MIGYAIPQQVTDSKLPQNFARATMAELGDSRYVLTDSVGVAAGLARELKRSDVLMYSQKGEVAYGLEYPDAKGHLISDADFPQWLAQARKQERVAGAAAVPWRSAAAGTACRRQGGSHESRC